MATDPHLSDAKIAAVKEWSAIGYKVKEEHGVEVFYSGTAVEHVAGLLAHIEAIEKAARTGPWLVARKRDTEPWEVHWFDRYDHAALHFDALQAQWSTVFFCRVAHCEGKPLDVMPVVNGFAERLAQTEAALREMTQERDEAIAQLPTDQPAGEARLLLNAYGRRCYEVGLAAQAERIAQLETALKDFLSWDEMWPVAPTHEYCWWCGADVNGLNSDEPQPHRTDCVGAVAAALIDPSSPSPTSTERTV